MNLVAFKNTKSHFPYQKPVFNNSKSSKPVSKDSSFSKLTPTIKVHDSFSKTLSKNIVTGGLSSNSLSRFSPGPLKSRKRIKPPPLSAKSESHINAKIKMHFKCLDVPILDETKVDQTLLKEFFGMDMTASNLPDTNRHRMEKSESYEVIELNNQSIHLSRLCSSNLQNSVFSSQIKDPASSGSNEWKNYQPGHCHPSTVQEKLQQIKSQISESHIGVEVKASCFFHLDRLCQILADNDTTWRGNLSFSKLLGNQTRFTKKKSMSRKFKPY